MANHIYNEHNMDSALNALAKGFTEKERWIINGMAVAKFQKALKTNIETKNRAVPYRDENYKPNRDKMLSTLEINREPGGEVEVGFTKKGKQAYLARFMNDGWDVRNGSGGPYTHVEGEHFWERTEVETKKEVKEAELNGLKRVMYERGLPR